MSIAFKKIRNILGDSLTAKEVFTSRKFETYFTSLVKMVAERYKSPIYVNMKWSENVDIVACTDNRMIYINLANKLVKEFNELNDKYLGYAGLLAHELGHVLFTDFTNIEQAVKAFQSKSWYPERPVFTNKEDITALKRLESFLFGPDAALILELFSKMLANYNNCLEDRYVNTRMKKLYPGNFKKGINLVSKKTIEQLNETIANAKEEADIVGNLMLLACYTQDLPETVLTKYPIFKKVLPLLRKIDNTHAPSDRLRLSNKVVVLLWSFYEQLFKDEIEKIKARQKLLKNMKMVASKAGGSGQNQQGDEQFDQDTDSEIQEIFKKIAESMGADPNNEMSHPATSQIGKGRGICCDEQEKKSKTVQQDSDSPKNKSLSENEGEKNISSGKSKQDKALDDFLESLDEDKAKEKSNGSKSKNDPDGSESGKDLNSKDDSSSEDSTSSEDGTSSEITTDSSSENENGDIDAQNGSEEAGHKDQELSGEDEVDAPDGPAPHVDESLLTKTIDELLSDVTRDIVKKDAEKVREIEQKRCCDEVCNVDIHRNVSYVISTPKVQLSQAKPAYEQAFASLKGISQRLKRSINDALEDKREGCVEKGLLQGNRINPAAAAGNDGKIFKRNRLPEDYPILAVSVLIDESGSMSGSRIRKAMQTAMILEDFCRGLDIPIAITGHSVRAGVVIKSYIDFEETNPKTKYRLTDMMSGGCNRDGFALRYCIKRLEQRDEPTKLLILISDGRPADSNYSGDAATRDLQEVQKYCKKKGITLFTAAIGDDKRHIQEIYGNAFLDISNLNKLPEKMVALVRKFVD